MSELSVRLASAADDAACAEIFLAARKRAFHWLQPSQFALDDYARSTIDEEVWVATRGGSVEGFVSAYLPDGFLHHLFVHPRAQRCGVGSELLLTAERRLRRPASLKCLVQNSSARRFYEKHGWAETERGDDALGPYLVYVKRH
ncbi:MAG TPA: GNAT family N-acetyltransferase [Polyangiaceae bacterium]|jgi:GNAT superfamily N-acetyltransferase|nr:GNAT family N-acetyltransferase [Polyangiaceae bacterium]